MKKRVSPRTRQRPRAKSADKKPSRRAVDAIAGKLVGVKPVGELKETLLAIRGGKVDALVVSGSSGDQVLTLQGAEHPYRVLVETTINEGAATLDPDGTVLYANNSFARILGVPLDDMIGTLLQFHLSESQGHKLAGMMAEGVRQSIHGEISVESADHSRKLIRCSLTPSGTAERPTMSLVATELTELVEANEALRINEDALRQLSARLLQLQDDERRRIARDLHDITGQKLAVLSMTLSRLLQEKETGPQSKVDAKPKPDTQAALNECLAMAQQVGEEIRTLSYLLHPPLLDELGLASALQWYTQGFESRTGICVNVDVSKSFMRLPPDAEVTLFRIVQESLTNVHRYSGSATAYIRLRAEAGTVKLEIGDSGRGINQTHPGMQKQQSGEVAGLGVGIQGMRERMRQLSGRLQIESHPNQGTIVTAILPIVADDAADQTDTPIPSGSDAIGRPDGDGAISDAQKSGSRRRILIADDHEMLRRGVRTMLESESGWEVCGEAANGQETVEKALALNPDLVILDINMPVLNGLAAVRKILLQRADIKFLVFTVHESDQTFREIIAAGAHGCLSKAKGGEELIDVVKAVLAGERVYQKAHASAV